MDSCSASKFFGVIIAPGNLIILTLIIGFALSATRYRRIGRWITVVTATMLFVLLVLPVGGWAMAPLENRFPRPQLPDHVDGILVLSGVDSPCMCALRGAQAPVCCPGRVV